VGRIVLIGLGGLIGAVLRYLIGAQAQELSRSVSFPYGTLTVNVLGCLFIGILSYFAEYRGAFTADVRAMLMSGLLGAFTTFSSLSYETVNLISAGQLAAAGANLAANNTLGLIAVWGGRALPAFIWR
jgi:CrcB protein